MSSSRNAFLRQTISLLLAAVLVCSVQPSYAQASVLSCIKNTIRADLKDSRIKRAYSLYRGSLLKNINPKLYQLFENVRANPGYELSADEQKYVTEQGFQGLLEQWRNSNWLVKKLNKEAADLYRSKINKAPDKVLMSMLKFVGKGLFPVYRSFSFNPKLKKIARNVLTHENYRFTPDEIRYLKTKKRYEDAIRFQNDVETGLRAKFAAITKLRQTGHVASWTIATSTVALGLAGNKYVSTKESFDENDPRGMSKTDDKVELIFLSPMPHVSLRVGGNVYNYGVMNIDRWNLKTYREAVGFGKTLSSSHTRVELNLTEQEKDRLRDYLEEDVGTVYPLAIPYVDCISQTNKAIKYATGISVPPVINRSQAMTIAYLKLRKFLGDKRIGDITYASSGNPVVDKAEDAGVNLLDSLLFMKYAKALFFITPVLDQKKLTFDPLTRQIR